MNERMKETILGAAIAAIVGLGVLWGALSSEVTQGPGRAQTGRFTERSLFCPGTPEGTTMESRLAVGGFTSDEVRVELEPQDEAPREPLTDAALLLKTEGAATNVVGFGGPVGAAVAQTFSDPSPGIGSSACAAKTSRTWYLPFGSSDRGANEFLYLYNPFPDEAVVRIVFYDENGPIAKANLADIAVPAGETTSIKVNKFILQQETLAAEVTALRGRVAAWKVLFSETDAVSGAAATLGARRPAPLWYFPSGAAGPDIEERISLVNPSDEEAIVSVSLISDEEIIQPPELLEMTLPRESALDVNLSEMLAKDAEGSLSVIVQSINEVGIVAERSVWYGGSGLTGFASEVGAPLAAPGWWLPPPVADAARDSVVVMNTGEEPVKVQLEFRGNEGLLSAEGVGSVNIDPGGRARISLDGLQDSGKAVAILSADGLVVAERIAFSTGGGAAAVMGLPIHNLPD